MHNEDLGTLLRFVMDKIGYTYDLKNMFDLLRYYAPFPMPVRFRRRIRQQRSDTGNMLNDDRAGLPSCRLPDPAAARARQQRGGMPAVPSLQPFRTVRFRSLAVFRDHQTDPGTGIRLPATALGRAAAIRHGFAHEFPAGACRQSSPSFRQPVKGQRRDNDLVLRHGGMLAGIEVRDAFIMGKARGMQIIEAQALR